MNMMEAWGPTFSDLQDYYTKHFSLGYLNKDINSKFALIALVCHLTHKAKQQKPDVTHYQVLMQLTQHNSLPEDFIKGLAIVCEDFAYGCNEFPTFGITDPLQMVKTIQEILNSYLPF